MSEPFRWVVVKDRDEIETFYRGILPKIRDAARAEGYAIGVHGSLRRDMDLIAVPWAEKCSSKDRLARAIHRAACGIESASYQWEQKPHGRMATCFPVCFPEWSEAVPPSLGHIDLSVTHAEEGKKDA